jgi:hypothetical protein
MLKQSLIVLALGAAAVAAQAQAPAAGSAVKKDYIARIVKQQQPGIEGMARSLAEQPAMELMGNAGNALPLRVPKDKQEAVAKEIHGDVQKYLDETVPLVRASAVKLAPATIGAVLEAKFSEDELKQLAAMLESPVYGKFQGLGEEMQKALADKVVAETRGSVEPKVRALEQTVGKRLGMTQSPAGAPQAGTAPRAPAKPAAK